MDKALARAVAERLRSDGLNVWLDEWLMKPGDREITVEWLFKHVPPKIWWALLSMLAVVFGAGATLGRTTFVRELFHK